MSQRSGSSSGSKPSPSPRYSPDISEYGYTTPVCRSTSPKRTSSPPSSRSTNSSRSTGSARRAASSASSLATPRGYGPSCCGPGPRWLAVTPHPTRLDHPSWRLATRLGVSALASRCDPPAASGDSSLPLRFAAGDARDLPFPAGSFDACRAERVFQHLPDPLRALTEMIRVTRPGGRVLVLDTDWGTTAVNGAGRRLTQRVLEGFGDHIAQGWIGRQLPGLFHQAGLNDVVVAAETSWSREMSAATDRPCPQLAAGAVDHRAPSPQRKRVADP